MTTTGLPAGLLDAYARWQHDVLMPRADLFRRLAEEGQTPWAMVVGCCDSRVDLASVRGADPGEVFVHRNVANFVPPADAPNNASVAGSIEYAVTALKVPNVVVMGHSNCGGVRGCHDLCAADGDHPLRDTYVGRWVAGLRPAYEATEGAEDRLPAMEREAVRLSVENLRGYPFVAAAVAAGQLDLHGLWIDIGSGTIHALDPASGRFAPI